MLIRVLAFGHETLLEGSEDQGARGGRPRGAQGGGRQDLLGFGAHHQALAQAPPRDRRRVEAKPIPGRPSVKGAALEGWLPSHLRENDDLTLEEHREAFEEAHGGGGMAVSASTVGRAITRLPEGWPLKKKSRVAQERDERERAALGERIGSVDPRRLVAVDECGTHTSMTRARARAPRGERA